MLPLVFLHPWQPLTTVVRLSCKFPTRASTPAATISCHTLAFRAAVIQSFVSPNKSRPSTRDVCRSAFLLYRPFFTRSSSSMTSHARATGCYPCPARGMRLVWAKTDRMQQEAVVLDAKLVLVVSVKSRNYISAKCTPSRVHEPNYNIIACASIHERTHQATTMWYVLETDEAKRA